MKTRITRHVLAHHAIAKYIFYYPNTILFVIHIPSLHLKELFYLFHPIILYLHFVTMILQSGSAIGRLAVKLGGGFGTFSMPCSSNYWVSR
jgi:hypothetical protein